MQNPNRQLKYLHAQQASEWVQILKNPTPAQRAAFVAWLKESPRNVRELLLILTVDQALDHLDPNCEYDINSLLAQIDSQIVRFPQPAALTVHQPTRSQAWKWGGIAASLILLTILVAGWHFIERSEPDWKEFQTGTSEQRAFELEDGSIIHLNTHSRVAIHFSNLRRDVRLLEGEALFKVHHDTTRPFRVYASDAVIQAVGTQFNVYNRAEGTVVAVIEGRVNIEPVTTTPSRGTSMHNGTAPPIQSAIRMLAANEEAQVNEAGLVTIRTMSDVSDAVAWQQRRLVFKQKTLEYIVGEFNRYNRQKIRLEGSTIVNRVYTGVFDADDPDSLVQVLARDTNLIVEKSEHGITLREHN